MSETTLKPPVIIYATSFNQKTRDVVDVSTDSGFKSIDEVVKAMGINYNSITDRLVIYGNLKDKIHVVFSSFPFYLG